MIQFGTTKTEIWNKHGRIPIFLRISPGWNQNPSSGSLRLFRLALKRLDWSVDPKAHAGEHPDWSTRVHMGVSQFDNCTAKPSRHRPFWRTSDKSFRSRGRSGIRADWLIPRVIEVNMKQVFGVFRATDQEKINFVGDLSLLLYALARSRDPSRAC